MLARRLMMAGNLKSFAYIGTVNDATSLTTYTFSAVDIGPAHPNRIIVVACLATGGSIRTMSSLTIGGNAMTGVVTDQSTVRFGTIRKLAYPTGTTANIVATFSGAQAWCKIAVYSLIGNWIDLDIAVDTTHSSGTFSVANDTAAGGASIVGAVAADIAAPSLNSQAGFTPNTNDVVGAISRAVIGSNYPDVAASGATQSATFSNSGALGGVLVAATFQ